MTKLSKQIKAILYTTLIILGLFATYAISMTYPHILAIFLVIISIIVFAITLYQGFMSDD